MDPHNSLPIFLNNMAELRKELNDTSVCRAPTLVRFRCSTAKKWLTIFPKCFRCRQRKVIGTQLLRRLWTGTKCMSRYAAIECSHVVSAVKIMTSTVSMWHVRKGSGRKQQTWLGKFHHPPLMARSSGASLLTNSLRENNRPSTTTASPAIVERLERLERALTTRIPGFEVSQYSSSASVHTTTSSIIRAHNSIQNSPQQDLVENSREKATIFKTIPARISIETTEASPESTACSFTSVPSVELSLAGILDALSRAVHELQRLSRTRPNEYVLMDEDLNIPKDVASSLIDGQ